MLELRDIFLHYLIISETSQVGRHRHQTSKVSVKCQTLLEPDIVDITHKKHHIPNRESKCQTIAEQYLTLFFLSWMASLFRRDKSWWFIFSLVPAILFYAFSSHYHVVVIFLNTRNPRMTFSRESIADKGYCVMQMQTQSEIMWKNPTFWFILICNCTI